MKTSIFVSINQYSRGVRDGPRGHGSPVQCSAIEGVKVHRDVETSQSPRG